MDISNLHFILHFKHLTVGTPVARRTVPDVRFSRIRFFGCTHFRADLHSCPLQDPVAIPYSEVGSYISSPTCPARVSFMGYVLPSGPSRCGWLSQPPSNMHDQNSASVLSPAIAANATLDLNNGECIRLVLFVIFCSQN